jgi:hypothetical protein
VNIRDLRRHFVLPRPTAWRLFVLLLMIALASEYWDKDALPLTGGVTLPWPRFMLALLVLPLLVPPSDRRWSDILRLPAPLAPMLVFWACCGLSIIGVALSPGGAASGVQFLKTFVHLSAYVIFTIVVVKWMTWRRLFLLVKTYYAVGIIAAVLSVLQFVHGTFSVFPWLAPLRFQSFEYDIGQGFTAGFRASSFFGEASWAARYFVHFIALAIAFWWQTRRLRHLAALGLFLVAFYAANSLLGYVILATFFMTAAIAQMWRKNLFSLGRRQKLVLAGAAYAMLLLLAVDITPNLPDLMDRSITRIGLILEGGGAAGNRIDSVFAGLEVWKLAPIVGVGLGNIDRYIVPFYQDPGWVIRSQYASDSAYVQVLAETGLIGLAAFLWFVGRLLWFSVPREFIANASLETVRSYGWLRFLQLDLFAQAVGMANAADYLNPHLWTVIAITLGCKVVILREARLPHRYAEAARAPSGPQPGFAMS